MGMLQEKLRTQATDTCRVGHEEAACKRVRKYERQKIPATHPISPSCTLVRWEGVPCQACRRGQGKRWEAMGQRVSHFGDVG